MVFTEVYKPNHNVDKLFSVYRDMVENTNKNMVLISRRSVKTVLPNLLTDSLIPLNWNSCRFRSPVLDIGSGAGIPGIPIAIVRPDLEVTLVDSNRKKTSFLKMVVIRLSLKRVRVICARIQSLVADNEGCNRYLTVVSRATAKLVDLLTWSDVLLKPGGELILWKGSGFEDEMDTVDLTGWSEPIVKTSESELRLVRFEKLAD